MTRTSPASLELLHVQQAASDHLDEIKVMFKPGVKVTLLVRTPTHPDRDFVMTDDDMAEAVAMLERRAKAEEHS